MVSGVGETKMAVVTPVAIDEFLDFYLNLKKQLKGQSWTWIPVFDARDPGGYDIAATLPHTYPIFRTGTPSLAQAYLTGLKAARRMGYSYVIEMDVGHPVEVIPQVLMALEAGMPFAIGSRFLSGGKHGGPPWRRFLSWCGGRLARVFFQLDCSDPTGGFIGFSGGYLEKLDLDHFAAKNYAYHLELKCQMCRRDSLVAEFPFHSRVTRSGFRFWTAVRDVLRVTRSVHA